MYSLYRQVPGETPTSPIPTPEPTIERIPKTIDGCTWYAYAEHNGQTIGATSRTKRDLPARFAEQWGRFAR